jgi:predicted acyltransferase
MIERMPVLPSVPRTDPSTAISPSSRIVSIDIFRGLVILVMIFVNDVSGVTGLPWWTYHMRPGVNGMTYVDMVFPLFLFILGMSIPLAVGRRLAKGDSYRKLAGHIFLRSASLVVLGIMLANQGRVSPELTGLGATTWRLLAFAGVLLAWNVYPRSPRWQTLFRVLKGLGFLLLAAMLILYRRRTPSGAAAWLDFGYWEILGLLGCAYFATAMLYLAFRNKPRLLPAVLAALVGLNVGATVGWPAWFGAWLRYWPFEAGLCSLSMAGVVASIIFFDKVPFRNKALRALAFGVILLAAGWALSPLGISKNHDTPAWCLLSAGAGALMFLALYWLADVRHRTRWAAFVHPAGSNTLLTYLLPDIWYAIPALAALGEPWSSGPAGAVRSLVFTGVMLALAAVLTRAKIRLQL